MTSFDVNIIYVAVIGGMVMGAVNNFGKLMGWFRHIMFKYLYESVYIEGDGYSNDTQRMIKKITQYVIDNPFILPISYWAVDGRDGPYYILGNGLYLTKGRNGKTVSIYVNVLRKENSDDIYMLYVFGWRGRPKEFMDSFLPGNGKELKVLFAHFSYGISYTKGSLGKVYELDYDNANVKQLADDIYNFKVSPDKFKKHVTFISGPPGTRKTSLVKSLAVKFAKRLIVIDSSAVGNDDLIKLNDEVDENTFILFDDVDAITGVIGKRTEGVVNTQQQPVQSKLTLGALLAFCDGMTTPNGLCVFFVTNHIEYFDAAVTRDKRVDSYVILDKQGKDTAEIIIE